jgi:hypothetical protein
LVSWQNDAHLSCKFSCLVYLVSFLPASLILNTPTWHVAQIWDLFHSFHKLVPQTILYMFLDASQYTFVMCVVSIT